MNHKTSIDPAIDSVCEYLHWDSDFFGCRIARINSNQLNSETMRSILTWCEVHEIDCVYFLADIDDNTTIQLVEENRFHFVDLRLSFYRKLGNDWREPQDDVSRYIRRSLSDDIPAMRAIARKSYRNTRFYYDSRFSVGLADSLYETWIENSCNGYADIVLVAAMDSQIAGYISCHISNTAIGRIGLVGVDEGWRGRGIGQSLVNKALTWFSEQGATTIKVATQGRNFNAQRVYQQSGFLTDSLQVWYHRWFT